MDSPSLIQLLAGYPLKISLLITTTNYFNYMEDKLHISHFKELYKSLKTPFPPINFLILGMLVGLEQRWVNLKAEQTVDMAIDEYMAEHDEKVYKAVVEETEDGGFTIGYFPEKEDE